MASPERLQLAACIVRPSSWLLLLAAALAVVAAISASVLIRVPVRVHANGMLLSQPGPRSIVAELGGRIAKVLVASGDQVQAGQPVALLDETERPAQIASMEAALADARKRLATMDPAAEDARQLAAAIGVTERQLATLQAQFESQSRVLSPVEGTVAEIAVDEGDIIERGAGLMTMIPAAARSAPLVATLYLPAADAKRVKPGMPVTIQPAATKREDYGSIVGRITRVAGLASTPQGIARTVKNQQLAAALAAGAAPIAVEAMLETDAAAPSGYRWTSSRGPNAKITMGTPCEADITVELQRLLTLLVPAARRLLPEGT